MYSEWCGNLTSVNAIEYLRREQVKWVNFWITDINGRIRSFSYPLSNLDERDLEMGMGFDGSSIPSFKSIEESDMVAKPDLKTMKVIPWTMGEYKSAFFITDIYEGYSGERFKGDPRYVAQKAEKILNESGFTAAYMAPEIEFFVFKKISPAVSMGQASAASTNELVSAVNFKHGIKFKDGYFQVPPLDETHEFRMDFANALMYLGIKIGKTHHEVATLGQVEIIMIADTLTNIADKVQVYKFTARNIAEQHGLVATFMPKPIVEDNGSGMHVHQSLWKGDVNVFYDPDDEYAELSQTGRYYIGGILEHAEALAAIVAPTVNSYKRLVPGFEAPVYICWGRKNRSALVRVPLYLKGEVEKRRKRIELRFPDPLCNPYLAFAAMALAGLDGIKKKIDPGDPVDEDVYEFSKKKMRELGIRELPGSLKEALDALESDEVVQRALGSEVLDQFLEVKRKEWIEYSMQVTPWEYTQYFNF